MLGGLAGLLVARWTLALIVSLDTAGRRRSSLQFGLQPGIVISPRRCPSATGFLFGLFPALHSTRPDLVVDDRAQAGQPSGARAASRFRTTLVTVQIALSMALLIAAGLFIKSLMNVSRVDLGVNVENVVTFRCHRS